MHITYLPQQEGGLDGKVVNLHPWGQGSIRTNDMSCIQFWNADWIFVSYLLNQHRLSAY
jgi:hypothetical protein